MTGTHGTNRTRFAALGASALLALLLATPSLCAQGPEQRIQIANVIVLGNRNIPTEKILQYIYSKPGSTYNNATVQDDLTRLANSRLFKRILPVRKDLTTDGRFNLYFEVQEHPSVVREVIYKHAKHVDLKELEGLTRVHPGMPLDRWANRTACFELQEHLKKQGYYFANVSLEEGYDENHTRVIFNITEGPKLRVSNVSFVGHSELATSARLNTQVETGKAWFGAFGGTFNPMLVEEDVIKLETYYKNNGYQNVHVSRELKFSDDFRFVEVIFHVQEGPRFRVKDWNLEGTFKHLPKEQLETIVQAKKGEFYNQNIITADVNNLTNFVGWRGYKADVKDIVTAVPDRPGEVIVTYQMDEHPMAYVGEVIIVGNTVTQDRVIRRMLDQVQPGQVLRYPELKIAEAQLSRLNIFEMNPEQGVRPTVTPLPSDGPFKDILVKVQETRTGSLMLGAGVNSNNGVVGSIVLNERNFDITRFPTSFADFFDGKAFRGAGQELRIEAVPGPYLQRYSITVREPYLFDQPYSLTGSAYYRDRIYNEYTEGRVGGRLSLGHQFTKEWTASFNVRAEEVNVYGIGAGAPVDYTSVVGGNTVIGPGASVVWDVRDSFLRPTQGGRLEATYEQIFGTFTYPIFNVEGTRYFTTWQRPDGSGKHVLMARSQFSWEGANAPVYERFFGGGYMSIRGFQFRGVGPVVNGYEVGGQFQFLNSLEYQIPLKANDQLYFVTFLDTGTVESKIGIHDYRVSAGFGFRISIPMMGPVPIALDFGFPIVRGPNDINQLFSFWVGLYR
ncbi:MAG TPA: outer membrane protein assembly factor BamA [Gemmataceae bacterium]|nr:outer membrane protein assembly factor BamA [Gemmataceae bacterium]